MSWISLIVKDLALGVGPHVMWWLLEGIEPSFDACLSPGGGFRRAAEEKNGRKNDHLEPCALSLLISLGCDVDKARFRPLAPTPSHIFLLSPLHIFWTSGSNQSAGEGPKRSEGVSQPDPRRPLQAESGPRTDEHRDYGRGPRCRASANWRPRVARNSLPQCIIVILYRHYRKKISRR